MTHRVPGSQSHATMREKEREAAKLLSQGLTVTQIRKQLRCSSQFVRQVRAKLAQDRESVTAQMKDKYG